MTYSGAMAGDTGLLLTVKDQMLTFLWVVRHNEVSIHVWYYKTTTWWMCIIWIRIHLALNWLQEILEPFLYSSIQLLYAIEVNKQLPKSSSCDRDRYM